MAARAPIDWDNVPTAKLVQMITGYGHRDLEIVKGSTVEIWLRLMLHNMPEQIDDNGRKVGVLGYGRNLGEAAREGVSTGKLRPWMEMVLEADKKRRTQFAIKRIRSTKGGLSTLQITGLTSDMARAFAAQTTLKAKTAFEAPCMYWVGSKKKKLWSHIKLWAVGYPTVSTFDAMAALDDEAIRTMEIKITAHTENFLPTSKAQFSA